MAGIASWCMGHSCPSVRWGRCGLRRPRSSDGGFRLRVDSARADRCHGDEGERQAMGQHGDDRGRGRLQRLRLGANAA